MSAYTVGGVGLGAHGRLASGATIGSHSMRKDTSAAVSAANYTAGDKSAGRLESGQVWLW